MTGLAFLHEGFGPAAVPYEAAWDQQRRLHAARVLDEIPDTCVLLEHLPVYTAGRRTNSWDRPTDGTSVVEVDRGGKITWHGPGQLVGYPIIKLGEPLDVVEHVRRVEEALIRVCAELGLVTTRIAGRAGVWVAGETAADRPDRKVAAIGIRVSRGVSMHGFALNADCDLGWYDRIVPCGITDASVTTLSAELGRHVSVAELVPLVERHLSDVLAPARVPAHASASATDP
jgi:lipoyl(octanoyl) transferase